MENVVEICGASVWRDQHEIVRDISWAVAKGQRWVIVGPNGAGKTTLVRMISGQLYPSMGNVAILGHKLGQVDLARLRPLIGLASAALDGLISPNERVIDVVRTAVHGMSASWREHYTAQENQRARQLLRLFHMENAHARMMGTLSTGEKKRVMIARALMTSPKLLILDEPLSGLDFGGRERLLSLIANIFSYPDAPVAAVMVTHRVEEIPEGFTHALLMKNGSIFAAGELRAVLTSENFSALYDLPVHVVRDGERYSARMKRAVDVAGSTLV